MNEERTFGIEIECHAKVGDHRIADRMRQFFADNMIDHEVQVTGMYTHDTDPTNFTVWKIKPDSTVVALNSQMGQQFPYNMEIVSPVLKGREGMRIARIVCKLLDDGRGNVYATASRTCGFHVHHHVGNETPEALVNVANGWLNDEKFFYFALPNSRMNNTYCQQWANVNPPRCTGDAVEWYRSHFASADRRTSLNFLSYAMRKTLEWRLHSGTVEWSKISSWILMTQRWLEIALHGGIVSSNTKTFTQFIEGLRTASIDVRRSIRRRLPVGRVYADDDLDLDEPDHERNFVRSARSYVARNNFKQKFIHPEAKKQRTPKLRSKTGAVVRVLLRGWVTRDGIVAHLDVEFGELGPGLQKKFVSGQLTNLKNMNWGFGFNIIKRGKKFRLIPLDENITHILDREQVEVSTEDSDREETRTVNVGDIDTHQSEALQFFIGRAQLFEGRRNPENLGELGFSEAAEEQQEHVSGQAVNGHGNDPALADQASGELDQEVGEVDQAIASLAAVGGRSRRPRRQSSRRR